MKNKRSNPQSWNRAIKNKDALNGLKTRMGMKAEELRIGNIIRHRKDKYFSDIRINFFLGETMINGDSAHVSFPTDDEGEFELSECDPIPLTPEWLERMGFEVKQEWIHNDEKGIYMILPIDVDREHRFSWTNGEGFIAIEFYGQNASNIFPHVKHVHSLQNLYHSIFGSELTIKELSQK